MKKGRENCRESMRVRENLRLWTLRSPVKTIDTTRIIRIYFYGEGFDPYLNTLGTN